eukprot:scaffold55013_cov52-Phaeocystis_antarctica.AAC.1
MAPTRSSFTPNAQRKETTCARTAPVQGEAQTCEEQTCYGLCLVLGLSPVWRTARGRQHSEGEADGAGQREAEGDEEPHGARLRGVVRGGVCVTC